MDPVAVAEASNVLGVSPRRVRQMLADGQLAGSRIGRQWLIDRADLDALRGYGLDGEADRPNV